MIESEFNILIDQFLDLKKLDIFGIILSFHRLQILNLDFVYYRNYMSSRVSFRVSIDPNQPLNFPH